MADVDSNLYQWSTTASSNKPSGTATIGTGLDDNLREIQAVIRAALAHKGADIASATTTDIGAVVGMYHDITGTTTITGLGTVSAGIWKILQFDGALTLTHNATSLILPGGANITTAAGDKCMVFSHGSGNWEVLWYTRANGVPIELVASSVQGDTLYRGASAWQRLAKGTAGQKLRMNSGATAPEWADEISSATAVATTSGTAVDFTSIPSWVKRITVMLSGVSTNSTSKYLVRLGTSSGVEATSYTTTTTFTATGAGQLVTTFNEATGFCVMANLVAAGVHNGALILTKLDGNTWVGFGNCSTSASEVQSFTSGSKTLSGTLDRVRFTTASGDTFDAGSINIVYE